MPSINKLSDIKMNISFFGCDGNPETVTGSTWTLGFYTTTPNLPVIVSYNGTVFSDNCMVNPDDNTSLIVMLNSPGFAPGNLNVLSTQYYQDDDFADTNYKIVKTYNTGIVIV